MIESAIQSLLVNDTAIKAIVSDRIYPNAAPQGTALASACIVYSLIGGQHQSHYEGSSGLNCAHMQLSCRSPKYKTTKTLAEAVRVVLNDYATGGQIDDQTIGSIDIDNDTDIYEPPIDKSDIGQHCTHLDVTVWHSETN